jgi:hypothetical protein
MEYLLTTIVLWLSINFQLPANYDHPEVRFATPHEITQMYHGKFSVEAIQSSVEDDGTNAVDPLTVVAVYNRKTHTVYLPTGWTGQTPGESSAMVHEMVHHLLTLSGAKFACPAEEEKLAYEAQEEWLRLMGRSLKSEFDLDPFTVKALTSCIY